MIILTSNGLSSNKLLTETQKYCISAKKAAIVTTASVGYKEQDQHIPRITDELAQLGLAVDYIDIETQNPELLLTYDVIEINGGNPFYLLKQIRLAKAEAVFQDIAHNKILIGVSAGSIVLQNNINLIAQYSLEMNVDVELHDFSALSLTNLEVLPHYSRFVSRFERFEERAKQYEQSNNCSVIRLDDGQGVFITASKHYIIPISSCHEI